MYRGIEDMPGVGPFQIATRAIPPIVILTNCICKVILFNSIGNSEGPVVIHDK